MRPSLFRSLPHLIGFINVSNSTLIISRAGGKCSGILLPRSPSIRPPLSPRNMTGQRRFNSAALNVSCFASWLLSAAFLILSVPVNNRVTHEDLLSLSGCEAVRLTNSSLLVLWKCQSQARRWEEGVVNHLC